MTILWDERGEQVSTFKLEDNKVWMITSKSKRLPNLHVFKTERVFLSKLAEIIRGGISVEQNMLICEKDKYILKQVPWREIAIKVIRERL